MTARCEGERNGKRCKRESSHEFETVWDLKAACRQLFALRHTFKLCAYCQRRALELNAAIHSRLGDK